MLAIWSVIHPPTDLSAGADFAEGITVDAPLDAPVELFGRDRSGGLDGAAQPTVGSQLPEHVDLCSDGAALM